MSADGTLRPFLHLLNREADAGQTAMQTLSTLPVSAWPDYVAARPGWRSYGVFRAMLAFAREQFERDPRTALSVTTIVIAYVDAIEPTSDSVILVPFIRGLAWKEHANALYGLQKYAEAGDAAKRAVDIFESHPALEVDVATATLIRAMSLHNLGGTAEALDLIMRSVRLFGAHSHPRGYLTSLQVCGGILFDLEEFGGARDAYRVALKIAEEHDNQHEYARTMNNLGQCNVSLDDLEVGEQQLQQAFRLFSQLQMEVEIPRTIAGLARVQYKRGALRDAISTFHSVYADLLHHGLMVPAAQVQVELMDIVTELTNTLEYVTQEGALLAGKFGDYNAPGNLAAMMLYVHDEAVAAPSVPAVRKVLSHAKAFLSDVLASPSVAFAAPS